MKMLKYIAPFMILFLAACSGKLDRSIVPTPAAAPSINIGDYQTFELENGLKVIVVQNEKLPRVSYQLSVDRDPIFEGDKAGYVSMAGSLMKTGTATMSKSEIDEAVDFIGASISTYSNGMYGACLSKHSDKLLGVMSDILLNPAFPDDEVEKLRKQTLSGLASSKTSANEISGNIVQAMDFGTDHPYGEQQTEKTTEAITRDDLLNYYGTYFRPNISYLIVVGDIDLETAKSQANKYFGAWEKADVPEHTYAAPQLPAGNRVCFVPLKGAVQSVIEVTQPVQMTPGHPDAIAASVMNNILGGGVFGGRLMQNLREDKAFTYGARASFQTDEVAGKFSASASVRNEVSDSSVVEFLYEIDRMTREKVQDTSLQFIKNYMNGSFARSLESPQTIASFALNIERYNLPKDYYATYLTKLEAVTTDDVLRVAKAYLKPENLNITVVGNRDEVAESLAQFATSGEVEFFDIYGQTYNDMQAAPEGMTSLDVFNKYYEAIGGIEAIGKINTVIETGTMSVGPMALNYERKSKGTDQMMMSVTMGGNVLQRQVLDGNRGQVEQMGQAVEMGPEEVTEAKMQNDMLSLLHLENYNMSAELKGISGFDDEPVYVVDLMKNGSVKSTYYFNIASGLQVYNESMQETPQGDMAITATINKYTEAQGVLFPSELIQVAGPQTIEVILDEIQVNRRISSSEFKVN